MIHLSFTPKCSKCRTELSTDDIRSLALVLRPKLAVNATFHCPHCHYRGDALLLRGMRYQDSLDPRDIVQEISPEEMVDFHFALRNIKTIDQLLEQMAERTEETD